MKVVHREKGSYLLFFASLYLRAETDERPVYHEWHFFDGFARESTFRCEANKSIQAKRLCGRARTLSPPFPRSVTFVKCIFICSSLKNMIFTENWQMEIGIFHSCRTNGRATFYVLPAKFILLSEKYLHIKCNLCECLFGN